MKIVLFLLLLLGFQLLFHTSRPLGQVSAWLDAARLNVDAAARQRKLQDRQKEAGTEQESTLWTLLERELDYTGLKLRIPGLTPELWIACSLAAAAGTAVLLSLVFGVGAAVMGLFVFAAAEMTVMRQLRTANLRAVNEHLMKLLDFLGNYSITAGEVTGVFHQVSRYMEEPIKSALETCYYEAQTTGDVSRALLAMAERIEHPKFKELARNMEISKRYCADFSALVAGSRRSLREYLRVSQARRGMLREAFVNMSLLAGLSLVVLVAVGSLVQMPAIKLLTSTLPGRIGLFVLGFIGILFMRQVHKAHY